MSTAYTDFDLTRATPTLGAYITGLDITEPLPGPTVARLRAALNEHLVLFFRGQPFTPAQHKRFSAYFGPLHVHPNLRGVSDHPELIAIHSDETTGRIAGDKWHSDVSCDPEPPMGSVLHIRVLPDSGGDTLWTNVQAAYDTLSEPMKDFLAGLTATHDGEHAYRGRNRSNGQDDRGKVYPRASHPVVRTHPETGRKGLFVNPNFTTRIDQLSPDESDAILAYLYRHIESPRFQVRFRWEPDSVAFWDNRSTQHFAVWDYYPQVRSGHRATIRGDKPR